MIQIAATMLTSRMFFEAAVRPKSSERVDPGDVGQGGHHHTSAATIVQPVSQPRWGPAPSSPR